LGQPGFENGWPAVGEVRDPCGIEVGDRDPMTEPCQADRGDQADVAGTDQEEVHLWEVSRLRGARFVARTLAFGARRGRSRTLGPTVPDEIVPQRCVVVLPSTA